MTQGDTAMLTNSKIALSLVLVLATASAAAAAPNPAVHHQTPTVQQVPASTYLSVASVRATNSVNEPAYMKIQDQGIRDGDGY
jgi:hypothetical protein